MMKSLTEREASLPFGEIGPEESEECVASMEVAWRRRRQIREERESLWLGDHCAHLGAIGRGKTD
jgi:hypothetical protein